MGDEIPQELWKLILKNSIKSKKGVFKRSKRRYACSRLVCKQIQKIMDDNAIKFLRIIFKNNKIPIPIYLSFKSDTLNDVKKIYKLLKNVEKEK